jgi:hypothetical protein
MMEMSMLEEKLDEKCAKGMNGENGARGRTGPGVLAARAASGDQKKAAACRGVVMFGDEASFWLDGTLHVTWSRVGVQPRVDTFGEWKRRDDSGCLFSGGAR